MSTRSGRVRQSVIEASPPRTRKRASPTRSPARKQKSSPTRVTTRSSPSRKSPSRRTSSKYPAPKSPSRVNKEEIPEKEKSYLKSPTKRPPVKKYATVKLEDVSYKLDGIRNTRSRAPEYTIPTIFATESLLDAKLNGFDNMSSVSDIYNFRNKNILDNTATRRSSRLRDVADSVPDVRRSFTKSLSNSMSKSISQSLGTYSENENENDEIRETTPVDRISEPVTRTLSTPIPCNVPIRSNKYEFLGGFGAYALTLIIPLTVLSILVLGVKPFSFKNLLKDNMKTMSYWIDINSAIIVLTQYVIQAVFLLMPVWGTTNFNNNEKIYRLNAFFCSLTSFVIFSTLEYHQILNVEMILNSTLKLAVISYLLAVSLAILIYLKSKKPDDNEINPYGNTGRVYLDFFAGRVVESYLMNINVKFWMWRICNINTLFLSLLIFNKSVILPENFDMKSFEISKVYNKLNLKPTLFVYSLMQIAYMLYYIFKEYQLKTTFYWKYEGIGYLQLVSSALYPYYFTAISKCVAYMDLELTNNELMAASMIYIIGFLIMLSSNNIKYEFRNDPLQPSLKSVESMPTFHGKKLLLSSTWGVVRHPNYFGDILIHIALALPGLLTLQFVAAAPALISILVLIHRAWRDNGRCKRRYGVAWQRYCIRVPSVFIPKIY